MVAGLEEANRLGSELVEKIFGSCVELEKMSGTTVGSGPGPEER